MRTQPWLPAIAICALCLSACPAEETDSGNNGFAAVCESPFDLCGESCVDLQGDPRNCGACDNECPEANHCRFGSCQEVEDCREEGCEGLSVCDESSGRCVPGCTSNSQCGNAGEFCDSETMRCTCDPGEHVCDGRCADDTRVATCGDRCSPCPGDPNGEATCDDGACGLDCEAGFLACDGACAACPAGADTVACDGGTCVATECEGENTLICDNVCAACPTDRVTATGCDGATCVPEACEAGYHVCGDACVDNGSVDHCGDACSPCPTDPNGEATCTAGQCGLTCDSDTKLCDGACAPCPTDGVAATECAADACVASRCDAGRMLCDGTCAACPEDGVVETTCDGQRCVADTCEEGRIACDDACAQCPTENVAGVTCRRGDCVASDCVEGAMLCGDSCSICPTGDSVGSVGCDGEVCVATSCAPGWLRCPDGCCEWTFVEADTAVGVNGWDISMTVGDDGTVHAAHANISLSDLRYGALSTDRWLFESADEGPKAGRSNSIALGPQGAPHISYRDEEDETVELAVRTDQGWDIEVADPEADPWDTTSLAVGADGVPHLAYAAFLGNLRYATRPADTWVVEEVAGRGEAATIVLDDGGEPWVCYSASGTLRCASRAADWAEVVVGRRANLTFPHPQVSAVWHDGAILLAYRDRDQEGLVMARVSEGEAELELVDDTDGAGTATGIAVTSGGQIAIAYTVTDVGVRYAVATGEGWEISDVATAEDTDEHVALGLRADGTPHILFQMGTALMHATF